MLPPKPLLDRFILQWLEEDIGYTDRTTGGIFPMESNAKALWILKAPGVISGLAIASRVFELLDPQCVFTPLVKEGTWLEPGTTIVTIGGATAALLMGERVALNTVMKLSGISTSAFNFSQKLRDFSTQIVDTRKTTPGFRMFEKYAVLMGGGRNHRSRLDDAVMIKDNHIQACGSITKAVEQVRLHLPITTTIEVETETIEQVEEVLSLNVNIIMLDNMDIPTMQTAINLIRKHSPQVKIEASGNITLDSVRSVGELGLDYISTSAMVTRSSWLDISMQMFS